VPFAVVVSRNTFTVASSPTSFWMCNRVSYKSFGVRAFSFVSCAAQAFVVAIALFSMDHVGRLFLLIRSSVGVAVALFLLGIGFSLPDGNSAVAAVGGLCLFMASFSIGWGPLTGVILAEVFPLRIR
jgi:hypothetical protein